MELELKLKNSFQLLELPISEKIFNYKVEIQESILIYLKQMNEKEKKTYKIAMEHLGTSFDVIKSTGYINWKKTNA